MRRLIITALLASFTLALLVGNASANRISTNDRDIEWETYLLLHTPMGDIRCDVTLLGAFHSNTIVKTRKALIGIIDHAVLGPPCTVLQGSLPWHLTYESFIGRLPAFSPWFLYVGVSIAATIEGVACLWRSTTTEPLSSLFTVEARGGVTSVRWDETDAIDVTDTTGTLCDLLGTDITTEGTGTIEGGEADINVFTLI